MASKKRGAAKATTTKTVKKAATKSTTVPAKSSVKADAPPLGAPPSELELKATFAAERTNG